MKRFLKTVSSIAAVCVWLIWNESSYAQNTSLALTTESETKCCLKADHEYAAEGVSTLLSKTFDTQDFPPRWECGNWPADLGWLHIGSDLGIFGAYFAIPAVLLFFLNQRKDVPFPKVGYLFAAFIMACGFGHLIEALIFWWPVYRFAGLIKLCTAVVSLITVFALIRLLPGALKLPSAVTLGRRLLESQERLDFALDSGKIGIWQLDLFSQTLSCDERAAQIFCLEGGSSSSSLAALLDRIVPEDRTLISESIAKCAKSNSPVNETFRLLSGNDSLHHIQVQGKFCYDKRGVRFQLTGVCKDVTDKQLKEEALLESEQRYRNSFENIPVGIAHVATDGQWLKVNKGLCDILGYDSEEMLCSGFQHVTHPDDLTTHTEHMRRMLLSEIDSYSVENRYLCKDGSYVWVNLTVSLIRRESGKPQYFIFVINDIDRRKRSDDALKDYHKQVEKLSLVASKTQHSILISDAKGRIDWVNEAFVALTGYDLDEVKGEYLVKISEGEKTDRNTLEQISESIDRQESLATEIICYAADGRWYWVELKIDPVFDANGELTNFITTQIDITDRKLSEESLASAKQLAEDASQAKSVFLASMSHELRTPLHGVIGMAELLADTKLDERQQRFVDACRTNGQTLLTIINDILDFSKIEAGRLEIDSHPFDLLQVLDDIVETIGLRIQDADLDLVYRVAHAGALILEGDSNRLRQVLVNLLGNATKFTQKGKIELLADPIELNEETALIRFSVKDSGIGIPPQQLPKLFSEFSQVHNLSGMDYGGTGLGLSICKSIVEAMGGEIGVNSIQNVGSEFWFTINFKRSRSSIATQQLICEDIPRLRVLVVDYKSACTDMLRKYLASWQMQTDVVADVNKAYIRLSDAAGIDDYDLLILERSVPDADSLAEIVRLDKSLKGLRVFLIAGLEDVDVPKEFLDAVIRKPLGQSNLFNAISMAFCRKANDTSNCPSPLNPCILESLSSSKSISVLVAEDNETNQLFVREVITRIGWKCRLVRTGLEALAAIDSQEFDVALMDCHMPEMDGFAATREVRRRENISGDGRHLPIIALTANAIKGDCERCLAAGMDSYLSKPFKPHELKTMIESVLSGGAQGFPPSLEEDADTHPSSEVRSLDQEKLLNQCLGNRAFAGSLLQTFAKNCRVRVEEIVNHVRNSDSASTEASAHGLKGISGIVGAYSLQLLATEVETDAHQENLSAIEEKIERLVSISEDCIRSCLDVSELYARDNRPS